MSRSNDGTMSVDTIYGSLEAIPVFENVHALRNNELVLDTPVFVKGHSSELDLGGGLYHPQPNDRMSTDDDGLIIVDKSKSRWIFSGFTINEESDLDILQLRAIFPGELILFPEVYGADGKGEKDDTDAFIKLFKTINLMGSGILYIRNRYLLEKEPIDLPDNITIVSHGLDSDILDKITNPKNSYIQIESYLKEKPQIILGSEVFLKAHQILSIDNLIMTRKGYCHDRDYNTSASVEPIQLQENTQYRFSNLYKIGFSQKK